VIVPIWMVHRTRCLRNTRYLSSLSEFSHRTLRRKMPPSSDLSRVYATNTRTGSNMLLQELLRHKRREGLMHVRQLFSLADRVALVTGGGGRYGQQIVEALAEAGATTISASRQIDKLEKQADVLVGRGLIVEARQLDQGDNKSVWRLRDELLDSYGRVDVLVNNAVARVVKGGWDAGLNDHLESLRINAIGVFSITRMFGEAMAARGQGSIINVSSIQGMVGPDFTLYEELNMSSSPDYYMHKGAMNQLTRYAAARLGPHGVRVNAISPGGLFADQDATFVERYNQRTFLGRMANGTDLKGAVVFLASDASRYVTGANLPIDGGYTAK